MSDGLSDHQQMLMELDGTSDRALAIVGVAYLEDALRFALTIKLGLVDGSTSADAVFGSRGPLSGGAAKAAMAWAVGLIGDKTRSDLEKIAFIRNQFAHGLHVRSFEVEPISSKCRALRDWTGEAAPTPRELFHGAVVGISVAISTDALVGDARSDDLD